MSQVKRLTKEPSPAATSPAMSERLVSLDVFRGLTVAAMVLVTDPGTYSAVYPQLTHAAWAGGTLTDMIFPSFLVITGVAMTLSFAARLERGASRRDLLLHVLRRSVLLVALGLLLNGFPDYHLHTLRVPGVLQRIGICYLFGSLIYLAVAGGRDVEKGKTPQRRGAKLAAIIASLLLAYWVLLKAVPVPGFGAGRMDSYGSLPAYVDRAVFGVRHLWPYGTTPGVGVTFDPEGVLSTVPALATLLMGVIAGEWMRGDVPAHRKASLLAVAGAVLFAGGLALSPWMMVIKKIWTPTFALVSGGFALSMFALLYWVVDVRRWRGWTGPAMVFGTNAILGFVLSGVITTMLDRVHVADGLTLHKWGFAAVLRSGLQPVHASLVYAVCIVGLNLLLLYPLYRRRIFVRL